MTRRSHVNHRCASCRMHTGLCLCGLLPSPRLDTRTRVVLFIHCDEDRKSTNTGRLASSCLANSEVLVRGHPDRPSAPFAFDRDATQAALLFPYDEAIPLSDLAARTKLPLTLVVPDGTWRQAAKVRNRVAGLGELPCVSLPPGPPSGYQLRVEPRPTDVSTIEAIARAMGFLEGERVERELTRVFRAMVQRTLWARGKIETEAVECGIPAGAQRHDPKSGEAGLARTALPRR